MNDCLFCSIIHDPANLIWQSDSVAAFRDKYPDAPVHVLVVPKVHIDSLDHLNDAALASELLAAVREVAAQEGIAGGYRTIINTGKGGGQVTGHLHMHVMGGKTFAPKAKD